MDKLSDMPISGDSVSQVQEAFKDVEDFKENVEVCVKKYWLIFYLVIQNLTIY